MLFRSMAAAEGRDRVCVSRAVRADWRVDTWVLSSVTVEMREHRMGIIIASPSEVLSTSPGAMTGKTERGRSGVSSRVRKTRLMKVRTASSWEGVAITSDR